MPARRSIAFALGLLIAQALTVAGSAAPAPGPDRTTGLGNSADTPVCATLEAPIGHRQPRAADLPKHIATKADRKFAWRNRELDRKLQICRGC